MTESKGNTAVPEHGDHDRVAMLSLKPDGTPDQISPEIIGDKHFALAATKEQFTQQAVSAVDSLKRPEIIPGAGGDRLESQDPAIEALKAEHDAAATAAESAATATVEALYTEPESATPAKATTSKTTSK